MECVGYYDEFSCVVVCLIECIEFDLVYKESLDVLVDKFVVMYVWVKKCGLKVDCMCLLWIIVYFLDILKMCDLLCFCCLVVGVW